MGIVDLDVQLQAAGVLNLHIPAEPISVRRRLAVAVVATVCLFGYLSLIPLAVWAIRHFSSEYGQAAWILLLAGCLLVLSLLKPLLVRPGRAAAPHRLEPEAQSLLFAFVRELAARAGVLEPAHIAVDSSVNCYCAIARALSGFFRSQRQLVIGLPLAVGLHLDQLGGVLAHEISHAAQSAHSPASLWIWSIHAWFSRVGLEPDAFDERVAERLAAAGPIQKIWWRSIQALVWPGRSAARLLMWAEVAATSVFLRGMEREADRDQVRVSGTAGFLVTVREINLLSVAAQRAVVELSRMWKEGGLVDNYPGLIAWLRTGYSSTFVQHLQVALEAGKTGLFSVHPCDRERMQSARSQPAPVVLAAGLPATALFADFEALCRQVTLAYYDQDLRLDPEACDLIPLRHAIAAGITD